MESTVGVIQSGEELHWVRHWVEQKQHRFSSGILGAERGAALHVVPRLTAVGIRATDVVFRTASLPFQKREQIRQVLPQEAFESLINRPDEPQLAFVSHVNGDEGSDLFYGVADLNALESTVNDYSAQGVKGGHYWISEVGSWPLLHTLNLIADDERVFIVDQSAEMPALLWVDRGQLRALRTVSPAACAGSEELVQEELQWLIGDQLRQLEEVPDKIILLNVDTSLKLPIECESAMHVTPQLSDLFDEEEGAWSWLRPAGLAMAVTDRLWSERLLNFRTGKLAGEINWKGWLAPWRAAAVVLLMVGATAVAHQSARYAQLDERSMQFSQQISAQFQKTLPQVPMVDPVAQVKQAYRKIAGNSERPVRPLGQWIAMIQTRVPKETGVQWKQLLYDNGQLQLIGEVPSYDHLDKVQAALKESDGVESVEMEKAQILSKSRHVQFNLKVM